VDLHSHLLPGLDDGAATMEETRRFARRLDTEGVRDVACTSHIKRAHFPNIDIHELAGRRDAAQGVLDADGLDVRLHPGGELADEDALELDEQELQLISQGPAHAPWLLLECPFAGLDHVFDAAVHRLTGLGYGLLLAHPERAAGSLDRLEPHLDPGTRELTLPLGYRALVRSGVSEVKAERLTMTNPRFLLREGIPRLPVPQASAEPVH
jgi:protein-tyrosine phosphatase